MFKHSLRERPIRSERVGFQTSDLEFPGEGDGRTGEIEGEILLVCNNLYDMRIKPISHLLNPGHQRGQLERIFGEERAYRIINDISFNQGFVSLDVNNDF